ncbi:MAG: N-terminal phage integrase SAM-like domain-containing protein, partial [Thermoanaerobaculia bacterium]|nr:N-terminal phage integrase SAM-like domain-containing protein [Thermoanaerobaculia bacterium]
MAKIHEESARPGAIPTLRQFIDASFHLIEASVAPSTARDYKYVIKRHLLPAFGSTLLTGISTGMVNRFSAGLLAEKYSPWSVHNFVNVLQLLVGYAVEFGVIEASPLRTRPKRYKLEKPCNELSDDEERALLAAFDDEAGFRARLEAEMPRGERSVIELPDADPFGGRRAHGAGLRADSDAAGAYFRRYQRAKAVFIVALDTGLRLSDYRLLRWEQVDL